MKKLLFILPFLAMVFIGCSNPTSDSTEKTSEEKTPTTVEQPTSTEEPTTQEPTTPQQPEETEEETEEPEEKPEEVEEPEEVVEVQEPEDKSPYEYVLPDGVDYKDYIYVGDYVFSDFFDFSKIIWLNGTASPEYSYFQGYFIVLEKIGRVQYVGDEAPYVVYDVSTDTDIDFLKGTSYKIYVKPEYIQLRKESGSKMIFATGGMWTENKNPDMNSFHISAINSEYTEFEVKGDVDVNDYQLIE